jgi:hypothetical protein
MVFYETDVFTARIVEFIDDESYSALQAVLMPILKLATSFQRREDCARSGGWGAGGVSVEGYGLFTTWCAKTRFSCFTLIPRTENQI